MATERYPQQNHNVPMRQSAVDAARARLAPPTSGGGGYVPPAAANGKGSRREVRPGEWLDDRTINIGGPSSPSKDSPPELPQARGTPPASYDPLKVYAIKIGAPIAFAGRMLSPAKDYQMTGATCTEVSSVIIDAVELGDIPADPDSQPS
jgi:hypothetical protein